MEPNITEEILNYAHKVGLGWIGTGGNNDFVYKKLRDGWEAYLISHGIAETPDELNEPSDIVIYSEDKSDQFVIPFPSARKAMDSLVKTYMEQTN